MGRLPSMLLQDFDHKWKTFREVAQAAGLDLPTDRMDAEEVKKVFIFSDFIARNGIRQPPPDAPATPIRVRSTSGRDSR